MPHEITLPEAISQLRHIEKTYQHIYLYTHLPEKYAAKLRMAPHKPITSPASSTLMKGNYAMQKTNRPPRQDPSYKELAYWKDTAAKRMRFAWATGIFGAMVGFIFHWVISMPPVWM